MLAREGGPLAAVLLHVDPAPLQAFGKAVLGAAVVWLTAATSAQARPRAALMRERRKRFIFKIRETLFAFRIVNCVFIIYAHES